ncbi:MAG: hypothetical protein WCH11_07465, partial [Bdellovibrio sp.]
TSLSLPIETALGALLNAITDPSRREHFQPTNINWGLFPEILQSSIGLESDPTRPKKQKWDKNLKRQALVARAQAALSDPSTRW